VVDESGRCIGVISGSDYVHSKAEEIDQGRSQHVLSTRTPFGSFCIEEIRRDLVRSHMTPVVRTVSEQVPLIQAARSMCRDHIHRLIVEDEEGKPTGILTALDLVATLIGVVEE
jgi:CBS domain-containing protein